MLAICRSREALICASFREGGRGVNRDSVCTKLVEAVLEARARAHSIYTNFVETIRGSSNDMRTHKPAVLFPCSIRLLLRRYLIVPLSIRRQLRRSDSLSS